MALSDNWKPVVLFFRDPSAKTLQFLAAVRAHYETPEGYMVLPTGEPKKLRNGAFRFPIEGKVKWFKARKNLDGDWQVEDFG